MVAAITADALLARVKARAQVPTTEGRLSDVEILALADDALLTALGLEVYDADDGRWVRTAADVAVTSGRADYRLPSRAWAGGIDGASLVDAEGNEIPLDYVDRDDPGPWYGPAFTLIGANLRLRPEPTSSDYSLRVRYVRRPSSLALVADSMLAVIISNPDIRGTYPSAWTALSSSGLLVVDVVSATDGGALEDDVTCSTVAGPPTKITRSSGSWIWAVGAVDTISPLDYACLAGTSCVVQCPDVAIAYLADVVARNVCVILDDAAGAERMAALAESSRKAVSQAIAERSRTKPRVVNRVSPLRQYGMTRGRAGRGWWNR